MAFHYRAFGLEVSSSIEFNELIPSSNATQGDISIKVGKVPKQLIGEDVVRKVKNQSRQGEYLLDRKDVAKYYVKDGKEIIIEPYPKADMQSVRLFCLGPVMAALLHQKRIIPLHASACKVGEKIVLFCGSSGVGKSTTAAQLHMRGYQLFTDDICVIRCSQDGKSTIRAYSSYPMSRLWKDAIDELDTGEFTADQRVRNELDKYANFFWDDFDSQARQIEKIVVIDSDLVDTLTTHDPTATEKIQLIRKNIYRIGQLDGLGGKKELFLTLSKIVQRIPIVHISRPMMSEDVSGFIDVIENVISSPTIESV